MLSEWIKLPTGSFLYNFFRLSNSARVFRQSPPFGLSISLLNVDLTASLAKDVPNNTSFLAGY